MFHEDIEFHVLELSKLHLVSPGRQARLQKWARFGARSAEELETLASEDAIMTAAKDALWKLSGEPGLYSIGSCVERLALDG